MGSLATAEIRDFLQRLGKRYPKSATLYLLGGGALCFLGNPRRTVDIDYAVETEPGEVQELAATIDALGNETQLEIEAVPIEEFIPLPKGADARHQWVDQFGKLAVYVYDPYSMASASSLVALKPTYRTCCSCYGKMSSAWMNWGDMFK